MKENLHNLDWKKVNGLLPVIIQDCATLQVLMLGYMNEEALKQTLETKKVTFFSRSKQRLWVKGEISGNFLELVDIQADCDNDTLLIQVKPLGPVCHLNTTSCFGEADAPGLGILAKLERVIDDRFKTRPEKSYTASLFNEGIYRIAQKVGEEGVEVALAGVSNITEDIKNESTDLLFHLLVLLRQSNIGLDDILNEARKRYNEIKEG
jgi:phosphoribosyl-ATP pyrophosphohydrolase/phosphoribosyl-AMP cyclohydrolase